jgi:hypothetical protein
MYEINELMSLIFCVIGGVLMVFFLARRLIPRFNFLVAAFFFILASNVFTVAEGFFFYEAMNLLEHLAYLGAGACVLAGVIMHTRSEV